MTLTHWLVHRDWPHLRILQKDVLKRPESFDLMRASSHLPRDCGFLHGDQLVLTVRGLHRISTADEVLADFVGAVRLAYERYLRSGAATPTVSPADLVVVLGLSAERAQLVGQLLDAEAGLFARQPEDPAGGWAVRHAIGAYREVTDVERYLAIQRRQAAGRRTRKGLLKRVRAWLDGVRPTRGNLLLFGLLTAVLGAALAHPPFAPSTPTLMVPTTTQPPARAHRAHRSERHRERGATPRRGARSTR